MNRLGYAIAIGAVIFAAAPSARAQVRANGRTNASVVVPAGMCRIWIDGVPINQQPAPTDCGTARATVPPHGRIIYGDQQGSVYGRNGRREARADHDRAKWERKQEKEREKWERKQEREREKELKNSRRWNNGDDEGDDEHEDIDDDHDDDDHDGQRGVLGQYGQYGQNRRHGHRKG